MILVAASALLAVACVAGSARRLAIAVSPARLDVTQLLASLRRADRAEGAVGGARGALDRLREAVGRDPLATWEQDLLAALAADDPALREALVNEQLGEYDWLAHRWGRVPRVCASVATSGGFLFASVALLEGLAQAAPDTGATLLASVNALSFGVAATSFCVAVHMRSRTLVRARLADVDRLVSALVERPAPAREGAGTGAGAGEGAGEGVGEGAGAGEGAGEGSGRDRGPDTVGR